MLFVHRTEGRLISEAQRSCVSGAQMCHLSQTTCHRHVYVHGVLGA